MAREIHHHRRLHHPNVAQLYEVIITETKVWLVLELCAGGELYDHLLSKKRLTEDEAQKIFAQICGAVAYIHSRGIVHRDLKLENIFLDRKGNAKLGDFGFTRENDKSLLSTWCGSLLYCAPEIVRGDKYSGEAVDIWSLGIILYTLLAGHLPFDDDNESATKKMILLDHPIYPSHFSDEMKSLLDRMLNKNHEQRPSAREVLGHSFLSMYSDPQFVHLEHPFTPTFTTKMERTLVERMTVAGIDIDRLTNSVMDYRCDALSGWWWLSVQKERRRERKFRALSKRRSVDAAVDDIRVPQRRSRSRSADPRRPRSGKHQFYEYKFPSNDNSRQHSRQNSLSETSPQVSTHTLIAPASTAKLGLFGQLKNGITTKSVELDKSDTQSHETIELTPTNTKKPQADRKNSDSSSRSKELDHRKQSIMQTFKSWWSEQTRSSKKEKHGPVTKIIPTKTSTSIYVSSPSMVSSEPERVRDRSTSRRRSRPIYQRRSSSNNNSVRSTSARAHRRPQHLMLSLPDDKRIVRSPSPTQSSSSRVSQTRPGMRRTTSASSNHSNNSHHSFLGVITHSKASSTSSNSTFTSTRSIRSPRNPLKVMPSTPPPYMIAHSGGIKERNIFDTRFAAAGSNSGVVFATRNKGKRGVLLQTKQKQRRSLLLNEVEEEDEEDEGDFVDEETNVQYPGDTDPIITSSRSLLDLAEEEEHD